MTPQLQQAIKLLQLSNLELNEFVSEQLEQNPFLEADESPADAPAERRAERAEATTTETGQNEGELTDANAQSAAIEALDTQSDDDYDRGGEDAPAQNEYAVNEWANAVNSGASNSGGGGGEFSFDATLSKEITLNEHLNQQLQVATRKPMSILIGTYMIDQIDEAGYLREDLETVADRLGADLSDVEETHKLITSFEPSGVGARNLKECMKLQLVEADRYDPAMQALVENIEMIADGKLQKLIDVTESSEDDVRDMISEIRTLTPKPGYAFGAGPVQGLLPDVFVRRGADGGWKIELNSDTLPRVLVNQQYHAEISAASNGKEDKTFVSEQFANATWLSKSLDQRARTILKVSSEIVRQQDGFFAYGIKHLRPMNLKVVANAIDMHESTISRVTSNKYMATPRGIFELKYFFTASIGSTSGDVAFSAEAVRHRIKELVEAETPETVLSDDKIVEILTGEGMDIARRTVAKYRETLNIPSSIQRRRAMLQTAL